MITGMEIAACQHMAVPAEVMQHVVNVESGYNPYAIGVVGGQLVHQPQNLGEAVATAQMLQSKGYNYSLGLAQVNRDNLRKYGLTSYEQAFDVCPNLTAGARILSECYASSGNDWGKSFSCYYSGNFMTGYRDGYVQKIYDSINGSAGVAADNQVPAAIPIALVSGPSPSSLHGAVNGVTPIIAADNANYRLAIRSTVLDTAATIATRSVAGAVLPSAIVPGGETPASLSTTTSATASPLVNNVPEQPDQAPKIPAATDVFEPQVRSLGDTQATAPAASDGQPQITAATTPSAPAVDGADLRQGGRDDAFVF